MKITPFLFVLVCSAAAAEPALEILETSCLQCHGEARMAGLDLRSRATAFQGGGRGPSIVVGHPEQSLLYQVVSGVHEVRMPAGKSPLASDQIAVLEAWIRGGAKWGEEPLEKDDSKWWSFQAVRKPAGSSIDSFIAAKLEEKGLSPLPRADRRTLIRRAYFDLLGLPPTPEAVEELVKGDVSFAALVDELLESPHYGERWGRHWLDVVRYADSGGFETDIYFPNAWRYRDYVIKSFNDDKPYDRFVKEQIAGDEIWADDIELRGGYQIPEKKRQALEARIGTGLYAIGPIYHEAALDGRQLRYEWMTDAADTTASAFMGLTLGCARCHDHKFDPLSQRDYHRMMAVFAGSEPRNEPVVHKMSELGFYTGYPKLLKVEEYQNAIKRIDSSARKRVQEEIESSFEKGVLEAYRKPKADRTPAEREQAARVEKALTDAGLKENAAGKAADIKLTPHEKDERERLIYELGKAALSARFELPQATVLGKANVFYPVHMTSRGDYHPTGERVEAGPPAILEKRHSLNTAARRRSFAEWLADSENPLTARVMVNRIWQGHFGRGIVATPNDFGRQGDAPTHPELLDWLSAEFVERDWSVKAMHRLIMLSDAYQRSSAPNASNSETDAQNLYLWRMNRRRLEAEILRDSVLAVAGTLNDKMGGRPVVPPLTPDEMQGMWAPDQWPATLDPREQARRSVYIYSKRSFPYPMFTTFDAPDSSMSCSRRDVTTVAPQALAMINSNFMLEQARAFAQRVGSEPGEPRAQVEAVWRLALGRPPSSDEIADAAALVGGGEGLTKLCLVALNLNEFLYVD